MRTVKHKVTLSQCGEVQHQCWIDGWADSRVFTGEDAEKRVVYYCTLLYNNLEAPKRWIKQDETTGIEIAIQIKE